MKLSLRALQKPKMSAGGCPGPSCPGCMGPNCMSSGGKVTGVHEDLGSYGGKPGVSPAGHSVRKMKEGTYKEFESADPKQSHERVLSELKSMKKPKLYAEGGEVLDEDNGDDGGDSAMLDSCAGELLDGFERKDKAQILESIKAIVLSVR